MDTDVTAGQEVRLPCTADHDKYFDLKVTWLVDSKPLAQELLDNGHYRIDEDNTLIIPEASRYDTTTYTCIAETDLDKAERTGHLVVKGGTSFIILNFPFH